MVGILEQFRSRRIQKYWRQRPRQYNRGCDNGAPFETA
jgi:hypothetical protein